MSLTIQHAESTTYAGRVGPRALLLLALAAGLAAGWLAGHGGEAAATRAAGDDLTRLLRAMAVLKLLFVAAAAAATFWRLQAPIAPARLALYAAAALAMAAGPSLIWTMTHVAIGAALMHAGLLAAILLLWRDPAVGKLLNAALQRRRLRRLAQPAP